MVTGHETQITPTLTKVYLVSTNRAELVREGKRRGLRQPVALRLHGEFADVLRGCTVQKLQMYYVEGYRQ